MWAKLFEPNEYVPSLIQLLTPLAIYLGWEYNWYWWALSIFFFSSYRIIGHSVGLHRYYCHSQFTTTRLGELIIGWFSLMSCLGSPASYTIVHLIHHRYSDTDNDPHGPARGLRSLFYAYWVPPDPKSLEKTPVFTRRLSQILPYYWIHQWYWPLILINAGLLYLISYKIFLFVWFIPVCLTLWEMAISTYLSHWTRHGYRPTNHSNLAGWLFPYHEYLHDTHHKHPLLGNHATKPCEIDYTYWVSKLFATSWRMETLNEKHLSAK